MADTLLDVVNKDDDVIGQEMRSVIHANGLLHREIHVWFITLDKQIVFQKRSLSKEVDPGMLTVAAGGHVEAGSSYIQTALIEAEEETGVVLLKTDLQHFITYKSDKKHPNGVHNVSFRAVYGTVYKGAIADLKVERGESDGYVVVPFNEVLYPSAALKDEVAPGLLEFEFAKIQEKLLKMVA